MNGHSVRSSFAVTIDVWRALFLREAVFRLWQDRIAWLWLVLESIAHVALMVSVFSRFNHVVIPGADSAIFITLGVLGFFLPRNVFNRAMDAIGQNSALFAYRQVKPVDTVLVRAALEGFIEVVIFLFILVGLGMAGYPAEPADLPAALWALFVLWLLGAGIGLTVSVAGHLVPEITRMVRLLTTPVYFLSAIFYPSAVLPPFVRDVILTNPFVHGIEALRKAFMPTYLTPPGIDLNYPLTIAVVLIFFGLALHMRFRTHMLAK